MILTVETLERGLNDLAEEARCSGSRFDKPERTKRVERLLTKLGKERGYRVAVKGEGCNWGKSEWMYDVVWANLSKDSELLRSIPLVMECEWGNTQEVWDDFQKLLISCAAVRVLIFRADSRNKASSLAKDLKQQIECFESRQDGDKYLFASYVEKENFPFSVEEYVFRKKS